MQNTSPPEQQTREALRVTWAGACVDAALGAGKIVAGALFHSHALLADGIHSLSDFLTDLLVLALVKISRAEADAKHPYGHARFETLGAALLGFLLVAVAGGMAFESARSLFSAAQLPRPEWPVLGVAALSIAAKEWVFRFTRAAARRLHSQLLLANAWHSRSDAWSSLVVCIGAGGAMLGAAWLDDAAAIIVAAFIARIGWGLSRKSLRELVDTAIDAEELAAIEKSALQVDGIRGVHSVKSRSMGAKTLLELHLQVAPHLSASESHHLGDHVMRKLQQEFGAIGHIIFHIDTEDDHADEAAPSPLPLRAEVRARINRAVRGGGAQPGEVTLHYLRGKIEVELFFKSNPGKTARAALQNQINRELAGETWLRHVRMWFPE